MNTKVQLEFARETRRLYTEAPTLERYERICDLIARALRAANAPEFDPFLGVRLWFTALVFLLDDPPQPDEELDAHEGFTATDCKRLADALMRFYKPLHIHSRLKKNADCLHRGVTDRLWFPFHDDVVCLDLIMREEHALHGTFYFNPPLHMSQMLVAVDEGRSNLELYFPDPRSFPCFSDADIRRSFAEDKRRISDVVKEEAEFLKERSKLLDRRLKCVRDLGLEFVSCFALEDFCAKCGEAGGQPPVLSERIRTGFESAAQYQAVDFRYPEKLVWHSDHLFELDEYEFVTADGRPIDSVFHDVGHALLALTQKLCSTAPTSAEARFWHKYCTFGGIPFLGGGNEPEAVAEILDGLIRYGYAKPPSAASRPKSPRKGLRGPKTGFMTKQLKVFTTFVREHPITPSQKAATRAHQCWLGHKDEWDRAAKEKRGYSSYKTLARAYLEQ